MGIFWCACWFVRIYDRIYPSMHVNAYFKKIFVFVNIFFLHRLDSLWGRRRLSAGWWYGEEMTDRRTSVS